MSCLEVSHLLGDAPRTVQYWVRSFEKTGLAALTEGEREGRPKKLTELQYNEINRVLRQTPEAAGLHGAIWDGKTLSAFIYRNFKIKLSVRQCQRIFRQLNFRLRKPRPEIARADPIRQLEYKKKSENS
jgi:transposase